MPWPAGGVTPLARARSLRSKRKRVQGACTLSLPNFRMPSDFPHGFPAPYAILVCSTCRLLHCWVFFSHLGNNLVPAPW